MYGKGILPHQNLVASQEFTEVQNDQLFNYVGGLLKAIELGDLLVQKSVSLLQ